LTIDRVISGDTCGPEEEAFGWSLRPKSLKEYIGQRKVVEKLEIAIEAAQGRDEPIEHLLFHGPPGLGKTTLAHIISEEMGSKLVCSSGPSLQRVGDLMGILTNLEEGDVLFIDEIHRLNVAVEEFIYPAIEDFKVDFIVDKGMYSRTIPVPIKPFTLIGATTRAGLVSAPLRERFGITHHLDFYPAKDIKVIIDRSAQLLKIETDDDALDVMDKRCRGTPRTANRLLRRVRDFAQVRAEGKITKQVAIDSLKIEGVDKMGLDGLDRKFIKIIIEHYNGGPVGIDAIAATLNEEPDTLADVVEPYLLKIGFVNRTKKGRCVTAKAFTHLGIELDAKVQPGLFD
jgi:holliday junction DNA helicase RuvB